MNLCSCYYELMDPCVHGMVKWQHRGVRDPEIRSGEPYRHIEHVGPLGSLGLNGANEPTDDFIPTGGALIEFFANSKVIAGTIVSMVANRKMVVTKDVFAEMFQLPTERLDTLPLAKLGVAKKGGVAPKRKLILSSSNSESTVSLPLVQIKKKQRTKRTKPVKPTETVETQDASTKLPIVVRSKPEQPAQPSSTMYGGGMVFAPIEIREINWATHFLPKIDPAAKGKQILEAFARLNPTYLKHDSAIFRQAFYKKMNEVVANINSSQTTFETSLVHQFTKHHQQIASSLDFVKLHIAEKVMPKRGNQRASKRDS
ncbi:DNA helicase isolog (ISS) [Dorcoceras hygrometricum]|uniref:DNA helicase isolog (ISS) n=1 Tax=Dorcoceras hygrometricum TaxID=472368 RepID=A0A2Z7CPP7_9LAMI|nr:DNA helicase isolog (ISS) [Dorcoceras hygrometricum]